MAKDDDKVTYYYDNKPYTAKETTSNNSGFDFYEQNKKSSNEFVRELKRGLHNFGQDYLDFIENEPLSAIGLPIIIVLSLAYLAQYYF